MSLVDEPIEILQTSILFVVFFMILASLAVALPEQSVILAQGEIALKILATAGIGTVASVGLWMVKKFQNESYGI